MSWYSATFNGMLTVEQEDTTYILKLGVPSYMCLTTIGGDFSSDEDFIDYIKKELRERNYIRVYFYKVNKTENERDR